MKEFKWTYIGEHELTNEEWDIVHDRIGEILDKHVGEEWGMFGTSDMSTCKAEQDSITVIRCKDCKYYRGYAGVVDGYCYMAEWYKRYQYPDDFCSRAERKEE